MKKKANNSTRAFTIRSRTMKKAVDASSHQTTTMPFQEVEKYTKWDSGLDRLKTDEKSKHYKQSGNFRRLLQGR
jgi:hypothetical protein